MLAMPGVQGGCQGYRRCRGNRRRSPSRWAGGASPGSSPRGDNRWSAPEARRGETTASSPCTDAVAPAAPSALHTSPSTSPSAVSEMPASPRRASRPPARAAVEGVRSASTGALAASVPQSSDDCHRSCLRVADPRPPSGALAPESGALALAAACPLPPSSETLEEAGDVGGGVGLVVRLAERRRRF